MRRIAFVGAGPKALFALLELHERYPASSAGDLRVEVFDPYPPGAGRVWQAGQPPELRLNVSARIVDASAASLPGSESFADWLARTEPRYSTEQYPPRAVVGRYLSAQFGLLAESAGFSLVHVPARVTDVVRTGDQWEVSSDAGSGYYDQVVLATGHGLPDEGSGTPRGPACNKIPLIARYASLGEEKLPEGSDVLIRGAALTAYDAVLLLTEGRDGRWKELEGAGGPWLEYVPSGREPARITMASRSTLPMDPKPGQVPAWIGTCLEEYRGEVRQWGRDLAARPSGPGAGYAGLWRILLACAGECARMCGAPTTPLGFWRTALTGRGTHGPDTGSSAEHIRRSIEVNRGNAVPGTEWLWARVWSGLYPEMVQAVSRVYWKPAACREFGRVSKSLERLAFGPPERTALKLLALFDNGLLQQGPFPAMLPADTILVDAVTPPSGVLAAPAPAGRPMSSLMAGLLSAGEVMVREAERGLLTDPDGSCIDEGGNRNESLWALGRPTEGPTLGHDTLNRALHDEPRLWAQRIAAFCMPNTLEREHESPDARQSTAHRTP
ncbi:FAD/NAD(P)-binding protein [Paeniglutamicibacter antarcticus]|uniref:FAD/NAD(P)-binding domain-containing protein n=1 Tax=Paeniglutamicibacter antarcticus TaxID=494023 RepID=A0ABP9TQ89_9MICC